MSEAPKESGFYWAFVDDHWGNPRWEPVSVRVEGGQVFMCELSPAMGYARHDQVWGPRIEEPKEEP